MIMKRQEDKRESPFHLPRRGRRPKNKQTPKTRFANLHVQQHKNKVSEVVPGINIPAKPAQLTSHL